MMSFFKIVEQVVVHAVFDYEAERRRYCYASQKVDNMWVLPDVFHEFDFFQKVHLRQIRSYKHEN